MLFFGFCFLMETVQCISDLGSDVWCHISFLLSIQYFLIWIFRSSRAELKLNKCNNMNVNAVRSERGVCFNIIRCSGRIDTVAVCLYPWIRTINTLKHGSYNFCSFFFLLIFVFHLFYYSVLRSFYNFSHFMIRFLYSTRCGSLSFFRPSHCMNWKLLRAQETVVRYEHF